MPRAGVVRKTRIPGVNHVVVVASGKGGVGKSTVSSNLALALLQARPTRRVGLLDLDVFGPSVPKLMGLEGLGEPALSQQNKLVPMENHGIGTMSMGYLVPQSPTGENPIVWRGIMVMKAVQQLLFDVDWTSNAGSTTPPSTSASKGDNLDVLVIDMPPGTGDVALSLGQLVIVDTAVVVSTPQEIALIDMRKGVGLFRKLGIPIHGLVLNMAHLPSATSMPKMFPFGSAEAFERAARELGVAEIGRLPLVEAISSGGDEGKPVVLRGKGEKRDAGEEEVREVFGKMAEGVWRELET